MPLRKLGDGTGRGVGAASGAVERGFEFGFGCFCWVFGARMFFQAWVRLGFSGPGLGYVYNVFDALDAFSATGAVYKDFGIWVINVFKCS